jgi:hypothetical protein
LPAKTHFTAVSIAVGENVMDDAVSPEFDGHYADAVTFNLSAASNPRPSPSGPCWLWFSASQPAGNSGVTAFHMLLFPEQRRRRVRGITVAPVRCFPELFGSVVPSGSPARSS